jgi:nucleotide-binding universal stress UspA family protein
MSYKSILVNLDIDSSIAPLATFATDLASRFEAKLVGFCAADAPFPAAMAPDGGAVAMEIWQEQRDAIECRFKKLHAEFEKLVAGAVPLEWREALGGPTRSLVSLARLADLIVTGASEGAATGDIYRVADPGSVVLQAGRPVLIAAAGVGHVRTNIAAVAWKDTHEARRAVADAVPLLKLADEVVVLTIADDPDDWIQAGVTDVVAFLTRHGIKARSEIINANDEGERLTEALLSCNADLVVSGAYGHSRFKEWVFGGITRSLLDETGLNRFMSS